MRQAADATYGIVDPTGARAWFTLDRRTPAPDVADVVEWYWVTRWELRDEVHEQAVVAHPVVNLVAEPDGFAAHGFVAGVDTRRLAGSGVAVAARLRAGAFAVLVPGVTLAPATPRRTSAATADAPGAARTLDAVTVLGPDAAAVRAHVVSAGRDGRVDDAVAALDAALRPVVERRRADPAARGAWRDLDLVTAAVGAVGAEVGPGEAVATLASHVGSSPRGLQRAFGRLVGVGPKWVLARHRVHLAAELLAVDPDHDLAALAERVGYYDQAHLTRDFVAATRTTPGAYARRCAASTARLGAGRVAATASPARARTGPRARS